MKTDKKKIKLYAFIDESGQDTKGRIFIVSILVFEKDKDKILEVLEEAEKDSGKKNTKWNKARYDFRNKYLKRISELKILKGKIFFEIFEDTKKYIELTSYATAKAILKKAKGDYKVTIFVDGFRQKELEVFTKGLRDLRIQTRKIRGVKKDENNAFIRLVDAICGLARDVNDGKSEAERMLQKMKNSGIVSEI